MNTEFGARLKEFRERARLSQQEFGDTCGLSQKTVSNLEKGRPPKASYLDQIEAAFSELNMSWLRRGIGEMNGRALAPLPTQQHDYTSGPGTVNTVVETLLRELLTNKDAVIASKDAVIELQAAELTELRGKSPGSSDAAGRLHLPAPAPLPIVGFRLSVQHRTSRPGMQASR